MLVTNRGNNIVVARVAAIRFQPGGKNMLSDSEALVLWKFVGRERLDASQIIELMLVSMTPIGKAVYQRLESLEAKGFIAFEMAPSHRPGHEQRRVYSSTSFELVKTARLEHYKHKESKLLP